MTSTTHPNTKLLFIGACCFIAAGCLFYYFSPPSPALTATGSQTAATEATTPKASNNFMGKHKLIHTKEAEPLAPDNAPLNTIASIDEDRTMAGTPAEAAVVFQWKLSRGHYLQEDMYDYLSYDWDTLSKLSDEGDIKAMMALAKRSITRPFPPQGGGTKYNELIHRAAVYGSSSALSIIAIKTPTELEGPDGRAHLLESLAWNNTAALRGDIYPLGSALQDLADNKTTLSRSEIASIHARSQEIYNELSRQRETLGLGPFDNSVPKEVAQYQENLKRYFKDGFKLFEVN